MDTRNDDLVKPPLIGRRRDIAVHRNLFDAYGELIDSFCKELAVRSRELGPAEGRRFVDVP